jgi:predicted enzyme related to lactoylglutathione lyase
MARVTGPDFIALQVRDLEAARQFYMEHLGLTPVPQSPPGAVVFATAPIPFDLRTPVVNLDESPRLGWGVALWLECDDADALCAALESKGSRIVQRPFDGPFGRTFAFVDPEGYTITLHS